MPQNLRMPQIKQGKHLKQVLAVGGTLAFALGIGVAMQVLAPAKKAEAARVSYMAPVRASVSGGAGQTAAVPAITVQDLDALDGAANGAPLELTNIVNTSALPTPPSDFREIAILPPLPAINVVAKDVPLTAPPTEVATPTLSCSVDLAANPAAAAMVDLVLSASCLPNERVTIHHNGMMFTATTDDVGNAMLQVPALAETAVFIVAFPNGDGAVASAKVPSVEFYDRVVVQWRGPTGLQLHAREFGANYGEEGHVWANAAREITVAARGQGGVLTHLGGDDIAEGLVAEIYTFPTGTTQIGGDILLTVEAEITAGNCARDIEAQTFQVSVGGAVKVRELSMSMPDCDAVGDFLVLNNMLNDLTIASN